MSRGHVAGAALVGMLLAGCVGSAASSSSAGVSPEKVVLGQGRDRTASQTAEDWVTAAEHVAVVTVLRETRGQPSTAEVERREGMIGRQVEIRVDEVVWSAAEAFPRSPAMIEFQVVGWVFNDNSGAGEHKFALRGASRLEPGHSYVLALDWVDDPCAQDPAKGRWALLGGRGTVPYDGGVLGAGEYEGNVFTVAEAREKWQRKDEVTPGLRDQMVGATLDTLRSSLDAATPRPAKAIESTTCDRSG